MPNELSGGMKKRVSLARAIAFEPKILLYDEPSSGLDPVTSAKIDELIVQMQKLLGVTSIVVTHDMKSAFYIADRIAMLYQGEMIAIGTPDEIRNSTDSRVLEFINVKYIKHKYNINMPNSTVINIVNTYEDRDEKLFKEMVTTKGKNGTGLGLFMSYSTIRAHFNGNITFDTKEDEATSFHIKLHKTNKKIC